MQKSTWPLMIEQAFVFNPTWGRTGLSFLLLVVHFYTIMNGGNMHSSCVHWPMLFHNQVAMPTISTYLSLGTATLPTIMLMLCRSESESGHLKPERIFFVPGISCLNGLALRNSLKVEPLWSTATCQYGLPQ